MNSLKFFSICLAVFSSSVMFAQNQSNNEVFVKPAPKTYLDSIKETFIQYETSNCIDERWMNELTNQDLFTDMYNDVTKNDIDEQVSFNLSTDLLKQRLKYLDQKSPFNIQHNQALENVIKSFLKHRHKSFERLMALSEYYFPMFEEHLSKYNLPLEIKYLAIVESALNPHARSHVGASGLWQFMYATGKQYNLEVNSYVDERYDPLKATDAACQYFTNMYKIFGDWDLVLASYNTGPGNVSKAIRRSGGYTNYWNIRPFLHKETQGYLPAFLATMYLYEFHKEHGIDPKRAPLTYFETDTVMVKQKMNFDQISELLDIPVNQIKFLNPIYKVQVIPYVNNKAHYLRLPKDKLAVFFFFLDKIYAYLDYVDNKREKPFERNNTRLAADDNQDTKVITKTRYYKVKRGDVLSTIAAKNKVSIAELRRWNGIKGSTVRVGQNLKIQTTTRIAVAKPKPQQKEEVLETKSEKASTAIAQNVADTEKSNATTKEADVEEKEETPVEKVETKSTAQKANDKKTSEKIEKIVEKTESKSIAQNAKTKNTPVSHTIKKGESLDVIAAKYNVSVSDLKEWNNLSSSKILAGKKLEIKSGTNPKNEKSKIETYVVKQGDTLYKIALETGLSIAELKKTNNLKSEKLKPGQVLKING